MPDGHLISAQADAALCSYLAGRNGVMPDEIRLVSLHAQEGARSDETGTLWGPSAEFVFYIGETEIVLEIDENDAAQFLDEFFDHIDPGVHGTEWKAGENA